MESWNSEIKVRIIWSKVKNVKEKVIIMAQKVQIMR